MQHVGSGSVILADGERASIALGDYTLSFVSDDSAPTKQNEFVIHVPHGYGLGRISTTTDGIDGTTGGAKLRVMFMPGGANGELVNAMYSLFVTE